jgi:hypothetical protein
MAAKEGRRALLVSVRPASRTTAGTEPYDDITLLAVRLKGA